MLLLLIILLCASTGAQARELRTTSFQLVRDLTGLLPRCSGPPMILPVYDGSQLSFYFNTSTYGVLFRNSTINCTVGAVWAPLTNIKTTCANAPFATSLIYPIAAEANSLSCDGKPVDSYSPAVEWQCADIIATGNEQGQRVATYNLSAEPEVEAWALDEHGEVTCAPENQLLTRTPGVNGRNLKGISFYACPSPSYATHDYLSSFDQQITACDALKEWQRTIINTDLTCQTNGCNFDTLSCSQGFCETPYPTWVIRGGLLTTQYDVSGKAWNVGAYSTTTDPSLGVNDLSITNSLIATQDHSSWGGANLGAQWAGVLCQPCADPLTTPGCTTSAPWVTRVMSYKSCANKPDAFGDNNVNQPRTQYGLYEYKELCTAHPAHCTLTGNPECPALWLGACIGQGYEPPKELETIELFSAPAPAPVVFNTTSASPLTSSVTTSNAAGTTTEVQTSALVATNISGSSTTATTTSTLTSSTTTLAPSSSTTSTTTTQAPMTSISTTSTASTSASTSVPGTGTSSTVASTTTSIAPTTTVGATSSTSTTTTVAPTTASSSTTTTTTAAPTTTTVTTMTTTAAPACYDPVADPLNCNLQPAANVSSVWADCSHYINSTGPSGPGVTLYGYEMNMTTNYTFLYNAYQFTNNGCYSSFGTDFYICDSENLGGPATTNLINTLCAAAGRTPGAQKSFVYQTVTSATRPCSLVINKALANWTYSIAASGKKLISYSC